jgi:scyllo-inositol 2-dehydrogenase (NADP+)
MATAEARYSVGIIGAGWVAGARHAPSYLKDGRARVSAVYDPDLSRARRLATRFEVPYATDSLDKLLERSRDAVSICTPPMSHKDLAVKALAAGKHVLVEKPMAMNSLEAKAMVAASEKADKRLVISHNFLFSRSMLRAQKLMQQGKLGDVLHAVALQLSSPSRRLPTWYPELPGGLFFDESPHMLYILRRFLGDLNVDAAWAQKAPAGEKQSVERVEAHLGGSGVSAQLTMSFRAPASEWLVLVIGTKAVLVVDVFRDILTVLGSDNRHGSADVLKSSLGFFTQAAAGFVTSGALHSTGRLYYGHDVLVTRFLDSIEGAPPPVTLSDSLAIVESMEQIIERWQPDAAVSKPSTPRRVSTSRTPKAQAA